MHWQSMEINPTGGRAGVQYAPGTAACSGLTAASDERSTQALQTGMTILYSHLGNVCALLVFVLDTDALAK